MSYQFIRFDVANGVGRITLNRPDVLNSFDEEMADEVQKALDTCTKDAEIRAVMITGEGRAFCAGQDLEEATADWAPEISEIVDKQYNPIIRKIRAIEKPVLAAVNGVAAGAGANIAYACDLAVAAESATFIQSFSKIGLIPDSGGTYFLPRLVGLQRAFGQMAFADKLEASKAKEMGLIWDCFPDKDFEKAATAMAEKLAKLPTIGLGLTKRALNASLANSLNQQLEIEKQLQSKAWETEDNKEGVKAFIEKREPDFKGE